jgi:hypothetical protein
MQQIFYRGFLFLALTCLNFMEIHAAVKTPDTLVQAFFDSLGKGKTSEAVDQVFAGNGLMSKKPQDVELVKQQINSAIAFYGSPLGNEFLSSEDVSPSLIKRSYLLKHDMIATHWQFAFYRAKSDWVVIWLVFDDKIHLINGK